MEDVVPLLLAVTLGGLFAWAFARTEKLRHVRNRRSARGRGWEYSEEDPSLAGAFSVLPTGGGDVRATDVAWGTARGRRFVVFDHEFLPSMDRRSMKHHLSVCAVEVGGSSPWVAFTPQSIVTATQVAFGGVDVEVESAEFNAVWRVNAANVRAAHAFLTPRMIDRFLQPDVLYRKIGFELGVVLTWEPGRLDLVGAKPPIDVLCDIADLVPGFLIQEPDEAN